MKDSKIKSVFNVRDDIVKVISFILRNAHKDETKNHSWFQVETKDGTRRPVAQQEIPVQFHKQCFRLEQNHASNNK